MMSSNSQDPAPEKSLSKSQELLLMCYLDGEAGPLRRWMAERLLRRRVEAQAFVDGWKQTSRAVRSAMPDAQGIDLWNKIDARIDQEERNALFLGERRFRKRGSLLGTLRESLQNGALLGGVSGGAVATAALIFFWSAPDGAAPVNTPTGFGAQQVVSTGAAADPRLNRPAAVSLVSSGGAPTMNSIRRRVPVEVEWMRSDGMVRMIPDNRTGVPIIWVNRQRPMMIKRNSTSRRRVVEPRYSSEGLLSAKQSPIPTVSLHGR
jgi:hypothetical protein